MFKIQMKKACLFFIVVLSFGTGSSYSQTESSYFPTGMKWQEAAVEIFPPVNINMENSNIYEIGTDTIINNVTYKKVKRDGVFAKLWVREENNRVWLLSDEYPLEFKLYDFNWDDVTGSLFTEYLQAKEDGMELKKLDFRVSYKTICRDGKNYQFHQEDAGTVIRNIGRVHELNRNASLLGYKLPEVILPGLVFMKVLWIEKDGMMTFQSNDPYEWSTSWAERTGINNIAHDVNGDNNVNGTDIQTVIYDLQGHRLSSTPQKGIYIQNGKKKLVK